MCAVLRRRRWAMKPRSSGFGARAEVAGDEGAGRVAMDQAGVAQEATMDEAGRLADPRSPASCGSKSAMLRPFRRRSTGGAFDAGGQLVGVGEQRVARRRRSSSGSRRLRARRQRGRPAGSSDRRRPRWRGRGARRRRTPKAGGRVVVGARGGAGAERQGGGEEEGRRGARAGQVSGFAPRLQIPFCDRTISVIWAPFCARASLGSQKGRRSGRREREIAEGSGTVLSRDSRLASRTSAWQTEFT